MLYDQFVFIVTRMVIVVSWKHFFQQTLGKGVGGRGGDNIGIVENSVMVAEGKLHCSDLDGTEVIARDNSNNYGRNFI